MNNAVLIRRDQSSSLIFFADGSVCEDERKPVKILGEACLEHGSSLTGRLEAFRYLLSVRQKAAVLISEVSGELWFPTLSMNRSDCEWLRYDAILEVRSKDSMTSSVLFFGGCRMEVGCDARVIREQMKRCHRFLNLLNAA